ncbi:cytochrome c oxidase assembly protein [Breoghania sp. L-A4]|uniref:cytochrome c oxidase assembly protein n=1 Tax=Breoghania sp. L-A4 TaxID=2304600 RepID=UPI000E360A47|nr:cytochrome c oxidase assembly protein [Breoghania sp. L-A4]AXS39492.1 cytochrome c oxidase assembly protein [Breoghania sp. L-A4]
MQDERKDNRQTSAARGNRTLALACVVFVGCMVGAAYAAVPLYQLFCRVTGYAGTTQRAESAPVKVIERTIEVRFDGNVGNSLPWDFKPEQRHIVLKMGEVAQVAYAAENTSAHATAGTATFNVTPFQAGAYFNKLDCFCFTEQVLKSGEKKDMPVVFFVDPEMDNDPDLKSVKTITLSYTFFPADLPEQPIAAVGGNAEPNKL